MYQSCPTNWEYDGKFNQFFPNTRYIRTKVYDRFKIIKDNETFKRNILECTPCIFINYMLCSSRDERFIMYQLWIDPKDKISLIWWRHLEYYWLIKYVSIVYSCSSIGRTQGCGSHTRFSLWQLFYNTSSWFMGAIYFPFSVHTESYIHCCYSPNMCFLCSAMQCCNISCC